MAWTDDEVIAWAVSEHKRAIDLPKDEARFVRYRAKIIFDKRFPNPTLCPTCGQKEI